MQWAIDEDGFAVPSQPMDISDYANVPACPNSAAADDLDGPAYELEVRLYEKSGRVTERVIAVTATCAEESDEADCQCECDGDYRLGEECPTDPDGGIAGCEPDAGPP